MSVSIEKLTNSEEQMMDIFWSSKEALTSVDIVNMGIKETWVNGLVHNLIRSLIKKGLLQDCGAIRYRTQYARKLCPKVTREEYAASLLVLQCAGKLSVSDMVKALIKEAEKEENIIEELEEMIL